MFENLKSSFSLSDLPPSAEQMKPAFSHQNDSVRHKKQRQVTLWITMATPTGKHHTHKHTHVHDCRASHDTTTGTNMMLEPPPVFCKGFQTDFRNLVAEF